MVASSPAINLVPLTAGIIAAIGNLTIKFTSTFSISTVAAGTLIDDHRLRRMGNIETLDGEVSPFREDEGERQPT